MMKFNLLIAFALLASCNINRYHNSNKIVVTPEFEKFNLMDFNVVKNNKSKQNNQTRWPKRFYNNLGGTERITEYDANNRFTTETEKSY